MTDENGDSIFNAHIHLEQDGRRIASAPSDPSGRYRMNVYPVNAPYDLAATSGSLGVRQSNVQVVEKERRTLDLTLEEAVSVEGTMLMLDNATPHVTIPVQAIHDGKVVAATFSDEAGKYQFVNLRPGLYQVRCQIPGGYAYYGEERGKGVGEEGRERTPATPDTLLEVESGETLRDINLRFAPFKKGTWRSYDTLDGLAYDAVSDLCRDLKGLMWFATEGGGVSCYDGKEFVNLTARDGLAHNIVRSAYADAYGTVWFGTEGGVSRYDGREFVSLTVKDGLAHDMAVAIHQEPGGDMWFGTHTGVSRYNGVAWTSLDARDGLAGKSVTSIHQDSDGYLWFATENGITRYRRSIVPPGIRIVSVKINGEYTDPEAIPPIIVGSHVSIEYSAIYFKTIPEKRQYRCCICEARGDKHPPPLPPTSLPQKKQPSTGYPRNPARISSRCRPSTVT